jgi:peptide/nickel transport system permease protein
MIKPETEEQARERAQTQTPTLKVQHIPLWKIRVRLLWRSIRDSWAMFSESKIGLTGLAIIVFFALAGLAYPVLRATVWNSPRYDPILASPPPVVDECIPGETCAPLPPSPEHLLGTDPYGRDILSQLLYGTGAAFVLGIFAALITVVIGTAVGAISAYYGGFVDTFFMRLADIILLFPLIAFLIVLSGLYASFNSQMDFWTLAIILGIYNGFGAITIVLKSQALSIKVKPYIEAAKVAGGSNAHIIMRHIIPNILPLSFLYMMFTVTSAIFSEAVLSFFGLVDIKMSWGLMINVTRDAGYLGATTMMKFWWLWLPAGLSITLLCAAFYLVGRGLDEIINPRLRRR